MRRKMPDNGDPVGLICVHCGKPVEERAFQCMDYYGLRLEHIDKEELPQFCDGIDLDTFWAEAPEEEASRRPDFYTGPYTLPDAREEFMYRMNMRTAEVQHNDG